MGSHPFIRDIPDSVTWEIGGKTDVDACGRIAYIAEWALRLHNDVLPNIEQPEKDSPLDGDAVPHLNVFSFSSLLISNAAECLAFLGESIKPGEDGDSEKMILPVYPAAQHIVVRSAGINASLAVWMLAPESRKERRSRCLQYLWEDWRNRRLEHEEMRDYMESNPSEQVQALYQEALNATEERGCQLNDLAQQYGLTEPSKLKQTDIFREACQCIDANGLPVHLIWNITSAAAHGMPRHSLDRAELACAIESQYENLYRIHTSVQEIEMIVGWAYVLTNKALTLLQQRSTNHLANLT